MAFDFVSLVSWWELDSHSLAVTLFLRLLGLVYFIAFLDLFVQSKGLWGKNGILPARDYLAFVKRLGVSRFYYLPTVFWLNSSDFALSLVSVMGMLSAIFLMAWIEPLLMLVLAYIFYLSFKSVGQDFLNFQWDALLLEIGFASVLVFLSGYSPAGILLLWFILFKFMVMAGLSKVLSGDRTWRELTAMNYHYQTQPLPNPLSWFAHQFPSFFQKTSVLGMLFIEIVVPFLIFGSPEARLAAFVLLFLLQLVIILTGNYGPLNLLTIVMSIPILGDSLLLSLPFHPGPAPSPILPIIPDIIAVLLILLNSMHILRPLFRRVPGLNIIGFLEPFEICNSYGLFAVMTTRRFEIIVEWSDDGRNWNEYRFRWKPQKLAQSPRQCAPHMPRLDWLMWFLPFSPFSYNPWFLKFMEKLLQNSPDVLGLLRKGPKDPPRYVRALEYEYTFTDWKTRSKTGRWWNRRLIGVYCNPVSPLDL